MTKYYEIICSVGVIGVTCDTGDGDDTLLHVAREDQVTAFGAISKKDFDTYGDAPWVKPKSKKRWKPIIKVVLDLERIA